MKKIIYRSKKTGEISYDGDYDEYLKAYKTEQALVDGVTKFNDGNTAYFAEIIELDDVAEFYAKQAKRRFDGLDDMAYRLRRMASSIEDIARAIKAKK